MKKIIILFFVFLRVSNAFAQSEKLQAMEKELVFVHNAAKEMLLYEHNSNYDYDSEDLQYTQITSLLFGQFDRMLNRMFIEDKDMTYPFVELQNSGINGTKIVWSNDSLFRVFSWMLPGGTQQIYGNVIQYKHTNSIVCSFPFDIDYESYDNLDGGYNYDVIYTLKSKDKTIYILSGRTQFSTRIAGYQLMAFSIQDELVAENIFKDGNGNFTNAMSISYEIGCNDINGEAFPRPTVDEKRKIMNLLEMKDECFTGKFLKFKFNGEKFKFIPD